MGEAEHHRVIGAIPKSSFPNPTTGRKHRNLLHIRIHPSDAFAQSCPSNTELLRVMGNDTGPKKNPGRGRDETNSIK
jgi:hypothetical protein